MEVEISHFDAVAIILIATVTLLTFVISNAIVKKNERKFGIPSVPEDIKDIKNSISTNKISLVESDFYLIGSMNQHRAFRRYYSQDDGVWKVEVEFHEEILVAYSIQFTSKNTKWLNRGWERSVGSTNFIARN